MNSSFQTHPNGEGTLGTVPDYDPVGVEYVHVSRHAGKAKTAGRLHPSDCYFPMVEAVIDALGDVTPHIHRWCNLKLGEVMIGDFKGDLALDQYPLSAVCSSH